MTDQIKTSTRAALALAAATLAVPAQAASFDAPAAKSAQIQKPLTKTARIRQLKPPAAQDDTGACNTTSTAVLATACPAALATDAERAIKTIQQFNKPVTYHWSW